MGSHSITQRHGRNDGAPAPAALPAPRLVQWMATSRCPLACPHCLADAVPTTSHQPPATSRELPTPLALDLVDQVADLGPSEFLVTGGEPLARPDLPVVLDRIDRRGLRWSLNTSAEPRGDVRAALERHPPAFVAVSVDGPAEVHDAFRGRSGALQESLRAIEFFASLGSIVAAGTTVTRRNFHALPQTLALVARTRAAHWGLHLLVPEGRARRRPDLFLRRRELRRLLRFVADKRRHFPVVMADEIGWCGDWEPLVRDAPWRCGAGREQCVVLPDGEVVPCTTTDRNASAGNVRSQPLADIWRYGFEELRTGRPGGACRACEHVDLCGGGCWLLRRHGRGCFRGAWETPRTRTWARAAGLALAAGLATAPAAAAADGPSSAATPSDEPPSDESSSSEETTEAAEPTSLLETALVRWNTRTLPDSGYHPFRDEGVAADGDVPEPPAELADDAGWRFFEKVARGSLPRGFAGRMEAIRDALQTGERSLSLSALLFRTVAEAVLDGRAPTRRSQDDRAALRETLSLLAERTETWRRETYERRLDPYLSAGRQHARHFFEMCKAYIPPPNWMRFSRDTAEERWGAEGIEAADDWLATHSWGEALALTLTVEDGTLEVAREEAAGISGTAIVRVTDLLTARAPAADDEEADDADGSAPVSCSVASPDGPAWTVELPVDVELTWADVVRLAYEQNRQALDERAEQVVEAGWWQDRTADPFLLPALRSRHDDPNVAPWLVDFWMF